MEDDPETSVRTIAIPLTCDGVKLLYRKAEPDQFIQMLNVADTRMRSPDLISPFKNQ